MGSTHTRTHNETIKPRQRRSPFPCLPFPPTRRYLSKVPFIKRAKLTAVQLRVLGELGTYVTRDAGETLFSQGEPGDAFYVILHGGVEAWVDKKSAAAAADGSFPSTLEKASTLAAGDHLGESALVVEGDRSATIKVVERAIFFKLEKRNFGAFLQVAPAMQENMELHTKERLLQVYRQLRIPFFAELTDAKIQSAARHSVLEHFQKGDVICQQGGDGKAFYVVVSGLVDVEAGDAAIPSKKPGHYFGEIAMLIQEQPVTATCTAGEKSTLLALPRAGFAKLFEDEPELAAYMRIKILRNHCMLSDILNHSRARGLFATFLKAEYADESLAFYDEAVAYKALPPTERQAVAKKIMEEYLPDGAPRQINVPYEMQKAAVTAITDGALDEDTLEACRMEVYNLMKRDSLPRFFQTDDFAKLLAHFGSYDMETLIGVSSKSIELDLELMAA
jgi:CRP-like cAMP-binding protein